jgi:hypothetical protein
MILLLLILGAIFCPRVTLFVLAVTGGLTI